MCPFLDMSDPKCAAHLTLRNIAAACAHCAGDYHLCPVYRGLVGKHDQAVQTNVPATQLRVAS